MEHKFSFKDAGVCILICTVTYAVWIGLELLYYGEIQSRIVDTYISIVLNISLFLNYSFLKHK